MTKWFFRVGLIALAILSCSAVPALAFWEDSTLAAPGSLMPISPTPASSCPDCHGLESGFSSPTVGQVSVPASPSTNPEAGKNVGSRKGPHSGYTSGTQKCQTCHTIHGSEGNYALLPKPTITETCQTCHDGTGGGGVYSVIYYRTGVYPASQHKLDFASLNASGTVTVPGGSATGGSIVTTFTGDSGGLTCTDCHSAHNAKTVKAFVGDRKRSIADTSTALMTNRLLRQLPTRGTTPTAEYGSEWCQACHSGMHSTVATGHPVAGAGTSGGPWNYSRVLVLNGYDTTVTSAVATGLGGSNFGYVMAKSSTPPTRGAQPYPICQQCHEDARSVGPTSAGLPKTVSSTTQSFTINTDGVGGGNPRFQNFPHESQNASFLVETGDNLCLNCH